MTQKMILRTLVLLFAFPTFSGAQIPQSLEDPSMDAWAADSTHRPVFSGKLLHYTQEDLKNNPLACSLVTPGVAIQQPYNVAVASDGTFRFQLPYPIPKQQIWFSAGELYFGEIMVTSDVHIELDYAQLKKDTVTFSGPGIRFSGTDAVLNACLNEWVVFHRASGLKFSTAKEEIIMGKASTEEKVDQLRLLYAKVFELENAFFASHDKRFQSLFANMLWSDFYQGVLKIYVFARAEMHSDLWEEVKGHQPQAVCNEGQKFYKFLGEYATNIKKNILEFKPTTALPARKADLVILAGSLLQYSGMDKKEYYENNLPAIQSSWSREIAKAGIKEGEELLAAARNRAQKATLRTDIAGELPGIPYKSYEYGADLYTSDYNDIDSLIDHIRSVYSGKAIIFDIWATWCAPCKQDMKDSKPKKEELKASGLPVEIVYLCAPSNSSMEKWEYTLNENEFTGTHFYLSTAQLTQLRERYKINGYPTYLTFNKKGEQVFGAVQRISSININDLKQKI